MSTSNLSNSDVSHLKDKINCRYCLIKEYKTNNTAFRNHENKCLYNPKNASQVTFEQFKKMLPKEGKCPNCLDIKSKLRSHAINCFCQIKDFSPFIAALIINDDRKAKREIVLKLKLKAKDNLKEASELPFF